MFKKKPTIKPLSALKSSERRRTADQIIAVFGLQPSQEHPDAPLPLPAEATTARVTALTALRQSLLPDNTLCARFTTTTGPEARLVSGTLYVGSHDGTAGEQRVLWTKVADVMYPTVYTLWHHPRLVPLLHTPRVVVEKLQGGADLMTPGLQRGPPFPARATQGAIVAIASLEVPTVPMAVGTCAIDISALDNVQGTKGHAVSTVHWVGDELWAWSATSQPGSAPPSRIAGWDNQNIEDTSLVDRTATIELEDDDDGGGLTLGADSAERSQAEQRQGVEGEDPPSTHNAVDVVDEKELSTKDIDDAFKNAFLFGLRHQMDNNKNHPTYGLEFPLSQSHVMEQLVQPFLPTYTAARTASLHIKKTSWKNLRKFIKYLNKQGIVKSKDRDANEVVIMDVDFEDRQVVSFVPYRLPKRDISNSAVNANNQTPTIPSSETSVGQTLRFVSLLRPMDKLASILQASKADPRGFYTPAELRQHLMTYAESENLVDQKNKRLIKIDPLMADALLGSSAADNAALATGVMAREALAERMVAAASPYHAILRNGADLTEVKPKAGAPPKIHIIFETRSGNKTITKIHGLEPYQIAPQPLADELRKACAGSTSVEKLPGSSPKAPVMAIMVQGPQKDASIKVLEKRGISKNWIEFTDKTKGKK